MMENIFRKALENAFDPDALQEEIEERIGEFIDYEEIARNLLRCNSDLVQDVAQQIADELVTDLPY